MTRSIKQETRVILGDPIYPEVYLLETLKEDRFRAPSKICLDLLLQEDTKQPARTKTDDYYIHIIMKPPPLLMIKLFRPLLRQLF